MSIKNSRVFDKISAAWVVVAYSLNAAAQPADAPQGGEPLPSTSTTSGQPDSSSSPPPSDAAVSTDSHVSASPSIATAPPLVVPQREETPVASQADSVVSVAASPSVPIAKPEPSLAKKSEIEVTVTANRQLTPRDRVTQSVRVLGEEDIALRPTIQRNLSELLRYEPGVFVSPLSRNDANWGSYGGLGPKYNTYLLDGLPIDSFVDAMSLDAAAFERVESQRGPASVMYSNYLSADFAGQQSPLAGTTNFVLRRHIDEELTRIAVGAGSYRTLESRAYHQNHAGSLHYFVGANYERSDYTNYGTSDSWLHIQRDPKYTKTKLYGQVTYEFNRPDHFVSLFAHHTGHDGFAGRYNRDFNNVYDTVNAVYSNRLTATWNVRASVGLRRYDRRWGEDYFGQTDASGALVTNQYALREHDGVRQRIIPADVTLTWAHLGQSAFTFGADGQHATYRTVAESNGLRRTQNLATAETIGAFGEERLVLGSWTLRGGARLAYLQNQFDKLGGVEPGVDEKSWTRALWSAGVRYNALKELAFYANAGSSFVPPAAKAVGGTLSASARGVAGENGQLPNSSLKPESGFGVDLGVESHPWRRATAGLRGFLNQATDAIVDVSVSTDPSQSQTINAGRARTLGLELSLEQRFLTHSTAFGNATFVRSRISDNPDSSQNGAEVPFVPNWVANAGVTTELPEQVTLAGYLNAVGTFYDSSSKTGRQEFGKFVYPSARAQKRVSMRDFDIDFIVTLNNLLNKKYALPWQFRDPGFNGMATVQITAH